MPTDPREPVEFLGEMPDDYEDEDYYGEEEGYADDDGGDDYEEEEDDEPAPKAKAKGGGTSAVRTLLFGLAGVLALSGIAYFAMSMLMPETLNDITANLPFIGHADTAASDSATVAPATAPGAKGAKGTDAAPGSDVAAVPPDPAKAGAMKPRKNAGGTSEAGEEGANPGAASGAATVPGQNRRRHPGGAKPADMAAKPADNAPMEGMPMEGAPTGKTDPMEKPSKPAPPTAKPKTPKAAPQIAKAPPKVDPKRMAAARAAWLKKHPKKAAATAWGRGPVVGWASKPYFAHGRWHRRMVPLYAVVPKAAPGHLPLATHHTMASLPSSWKRRPAGGHYAVQIGSFSNSGNASELVSQLRAQGITAYASGGSGRSRVFIGSFASRQAAATKMAQLQAQGIPAAVTAQ